MGMEIESSEERSVVTSLSIGKRRSDSTLPLERKVESLRADLSLPGGIKVTFDTADPDAKIDAQGLAFLADMFKLVGQVVYTVVLDDHNKVKAIEGTEKLQEKAEKLDPQVAVMVSKQFEATSSREASSKSLRSCPMCWPAPASHGSEPRSSRSVAARR